MTVRGVSPINAALRAYRELKEFERATMLARAVPWCIKASICPNRRLWAELKKTLKTKRIEQATSIYRVLINVD